MEAYNADINKQNKYILTTDLSYDEVYNKLENVTY